MIIHIVLIVNLLFFPHFYKLESTLIWISIDGFRHDYFDENITPNLCEFKKKSSYSIEHVPTFASKTFPIHMSQITGLHQEQHGIINNHMYNEKLGSFNHSVTDLAWWDPKNIRQTIWTINQKHGGKSSVLYWPGADVKFDGVYPNDYKEKYNKMCKAGCRLTDAARKIKLGLYNLVMVYLEDIDDAGHKYGPDSDERIRVTKEVDSAFEQFISSISESNIANNFTIMISSDHGMVSTPKENHFNLEQLLRDFQYKVVSYGSIVQLKTSLSEAVKIKQVLASLPAVQYVYLKNQIPSKYRYKDNPNVPELTIIPRNGHYLYFGKQRTPLTLGDHGYPYEISPEMQAIFMIAGPEIPKDNQLEKTTNLDLFIIACKVLGFDSTCSRLSYGARLPEKLFSTVNANKNTILIVSILIPAILIVLLISTIAIVVHLKKKRKNKFQTLSIRQMYK